VDTLNWEFTRDELKIRKESRNAVVLCKMKDETEKNKGLASLTNWPKQPRNVRVSRWRTASGMLEIRQKDKLSIKCSESIGFKGEMDNKQSRVERPTGDRYALTASWRARPSLPQDCLHIHSRVSVLALGWRSSSQRMLDYEGHVDCEDSLKSKG
jgi:hypothetical protein